MKEKENRMKKLKLSEDEEVLKLILTDNVEAWEYEFDVPTMLRLLKALKSNCEVKCFEQNLASYFLSSQPLPKVTEDPLYLDTTLFKAAGISSLEECAVKYPNLRNDYIKDNLVDRLRGIGLEVDLEEERLIGWSLMNQDFHKVIVLSIMSLNELRDIIKRKGKSDFYYEKISIPFSKMYNLIFSTDPHIINIRLRKGGEEIVRLIEKLDAKLWRT